MDGKADFGTESFGALLRRFRGRLGLTQEELADRAGLYAQQISQLERDIVRRPRSTTVEYLAEALKLDAQERATFVAAARGAPVSAAVDDSSGSNGVQDSSPGLVDADALLASMPTDALPPRSPLPAGSRMPLAPNPLFVGRGKEVLQIATALKGGDTTVAFGQVVASTGLGGLGKTQLAVELVHRYGRYFAGGVFWLDFASANEIPLQIAACAGAGAMDLVPGIEDHPVEERVQRVQRAWRSAVPRLLVFDNCEDEALLEAWRPTSGGCLLLVTSRRPRWSPALGVRALPLDLLPRSDSIELLRRYRPDLAPEDPGLDAIAEELGDLPLALHLAGSYLHAYGSEVSLDDYLAELRRSEVVQHASLLGAGLDDSPSPTRHVQGVAQTFALCLGRLDRKREVDRMAIALLARMACMAPGKPVPRELLAKTLEDVDPLLRADGLKRLAAVGMVEEGEGWLVLHQLLVHFVRQEGIDPDAQQAVARLLVGCGKEAQAHQLTGSALATVIPHLVHMVGRAAESIGDERLVAELCSAAGQALQSAGDLGAARPWFERAVAIVQRVLETDHPDTATSINHLGELLFSQGDLEAARSLTQRALDIRERVLGQDHLDTAESLNNLALLLYKQGELAAARSLYERALDICARVQGSNPSDTAAILNNLAEVLWAQGELGGARLLFERGLAIRERALGPDNPGVTFNLNGLAIVHRDQGELDDARALFERVLNIRQMALGPHHLHTSASLHNLARILLMQGDPAAARPLFERALAIRERVLGPDHPDTVATRGALEELAAEGDGAGAGG
jgi:tetratricopeptide (TPR) repeat protein/transcriptional regulator with XRE-family HTH domain